MNAWIHYSVVQLVGRHLDMCTVLMLIALPPTCLHLLLQAAIQ